MRDRFRFVYNVLMGYYETLEFLGDDPIHDKFTFLPFVRTWWLNMLRKVEKDS